MALKRPKLAPKARLKRDLMRRRKKEKKIRRKLTEGWSLKRADAVFSAKVRERDGICLFPNCGTTNNLTCSHYFGRATKSTRFDLENCITLCGTHHFWDKMLGWEFQKQRIPEQEWDGRYTVFMRTHLGEDRFNALIEKSKQSVKQKDAILAFYQTTPDYETKQAHYRRLLEELGDNLEK